MSEKKTDRLEIRTEESMTAAIRRAAEKKKVKPAKLVRDAISNYPPIKEALEK